MVILAMMDLLFVKKNNKHKQKQQNKTSKLTGSFQSFWSFRLRLFSGVGCLRLSGDTQKIEDGKLVSL
jgi:hypothetical protein